MEVEGTIKVIGETKSYGSSGFQKREVVVTTEEQYPQHLNIEFVQDKTSLPDNFQVGDPVKVGINLRGREWTSPQGEVKYFNSIVGWRMEKKNSAQPSASSGQPAPPPFPTTNNAGGSAMDDDDDDLPF